MLSLFALNVKMYNYGELLDFESACIISFKSHGTFGNRLSSCSNQKSCSIVRLLRGKRLVMCLLHNLPTTTMHVYLVIAQLDFNKQ